MATIQTKNQKNKNDDLVYVGDYFRNLGANISWKPQETPVGGFYGKVVINNTEIDPAAAGFTLRSDNHLYAQKETLDALAKQLGLTNQPVAAQTTTAQQTTPQTTTVQQTTPQFDIATEIEKLRQAQIQRRLAALDQARASALSSLAAERAQIGPAYYQARNQEASRSQLAAKNFAEYMAARGQSTAGISGQAELARNIALQGAISDLVRQERQAHEDIARRQSTIEQQYQLGRTQAMSEADALAAQMMIQELGRQRDLALEQERYEREYGWREKMADEDRRRYEQQFAYQHERDLASDERWREEFEEAKRQFELQFTESQRRWNLEYEFDVRKQTFAERQAEIENAVRNRQLSLQEAELQLVRDKFMAENDPNSLDNQIKRAQLERATSNERINTYAEQIERLYTTNLYDPEGRITGKSYNFPAIMTYIQNLNQSGLITDNEAKQLLGMYGFSY